MCYIKLGRYSLWPNIYYDLAYFIAFKSLYYLYTKLYNPSRLRDDDSWLSLFHEQGYGKYRLTLIEVPSLHFPGENEEIPFKKVSPDVWSLGSNTCVLHYWYDIRHVTDWITGTGLHLWHFGSVNNLQLCIFSEQQDMNKMMTWTRI